MPRARSCRPCGRQIRTTSKRVGSSCGCKFKKEIPNRLWFPYLCLRLGTSCFLGKGLGPLRARRGPPRPCPWSQTARRARSAAARSGARARSPTPGGPARRVAAPQPGLLLEGRGLGARVRGHGVQQEDVVRCRQVRAAGAVLQREQQHLRSGDSDTIFPMRVRVVRIDVIIGTSPGPGSRRCARASGV